MAAITVEGLTAWINGYAALITEHQAELTELDSPIGDADHGLNMNRGMTAVLAAIGATPPTTAEALFKGVAMTMISTVGGASGPLYGTFFLRLGMTAGAESELDLVSFGTALRAGLDGVISRGKAQPGDKTMIDALGPAIEAWQREAASGASPGEAASAAFAAAEAGRDATTPMIARKGRASYVGERSAGHTDPGAASSALLFQALRDVLGAGA
ncbi:dihydroxyacetone kinase subunit DhaL [Microbacterium mangrovi]|uniref:dihydroxyacetone kinase subunit DhaL n=1 Tax=Microbacterium mangrovi TaxID=1348253 RepID=UPI000A83BA18|nr:dihydroxyacetone kinase subunit DhaL [Microbacterium mangrovi]